MKTIIHKGTKIRQEKRGVWHVMETRGGFPTGKKTFTGTLAECKSALA